MTDAAQTTMGKVNELVAETKKIAEERRPRIALLISLLSVPTIADIALVARKLVAS